MRVERTQYVGWIKGFLLSVLLVMGSGVLRGQTLPKIADKAIQQPSCENPAIIKVKIEEGKPPYRVFCEEDNSGGDAFMREVSAAGWVEIRVASSPDKEIHYTVYVQDADGKEVAEPFIIEAHPEKKNRIVIEHLKATDGEVGCYSQPKGSFSFKLENKPSNNVNYTVSNLLGNPVSYGTGIYSGNPIPFNSLSRGVYLIEMEEEKGCLYSTKVELLGGYKATLKITGQENPSNLINSDGKISFRLEFPNNRKIPNEKVAKVSLIGSKLNNEELPLNEEYKVNNLKDGEYTPFVKEVVYASTVCNYIYPTSITLISRGLLVEKDLIEHPACDGQKGKITVDFYNLDNNKDVPFWVKCEGGGTKLWKEVKDVNTPIVIEGLEATRGRTVYRVEAYKEKGKEETQIHDISPSAPFDIYEYIPPSIILDPGKKPIPPTCEGKSDGKVSIILINNGEGDLCDYNITIEGAGITPQTLSTSSGAFFEDLPAGSYKVKAMSTHNKPCPTSPPELPIELPKPTPLRLFYKLEDNTSCDQKTMSVVIKELQGDIDDDKKASVTLTPTSNGSAITHTYERQNGWQWETQPFSLEVGEEYSVEATFFDRGGSDCPMVSEHKIKIPALRSYENIRCHAEEGTLFTEIAKGNVQGLQVKPQTPDAQYTPMTPDPSKPSIYQWNGAKVKEKEAFKLSWQSADQQSDPQKPRWTEGCIFTVPTLEELKVTLPKDPQGHCGKADKVPIDVVGGEPFTDPSNNYWFGKKEDNAGDKTPTVGNVAAAPSFSTGEVTNKDTYVLYDKRGCEKEITFADIIRKPFELRDVKPTWSLCLSHDSLDKTLLGATGVDQIKVILPKEPASSTYTIDLLNEANQASPIHTEKSAAGKELIFKDNAAGTTLFPDRSKELVFILKATDDQHCEVLSEPITMPALLPTVNTVSDFSHAERQGQWCKPDAYGYKQLVINKLKGDKAPYTVTWEIDDGSGPKPVAVGTVADVAGDGSKPVILEAAKDGKPFAPGKYQIRVKADDACDYLYHYEIPNIEPLNVEADFKAEKCATGDGHVATLSNIEVTGGDPFKEKGKPYLAYYLDAKEAKFDAAHASEGNLHYNVINLSAGKEEKAVNTNQLKLFVFDSQHCADSVEIDGNVVIPQVLTFTHTIHEPICYGDSTGIVYIRSEAKNADYYLLKDDGALYDTVQGTNTHGVFSGVWAGKYKVILRDPESGCDVSETFTIKDKYPELKLTLPSGIKPLKCPDSYIPLEVKIEGGSKDYKTYQWSYEDEKSGNTEHIFTKEPKLPKAYAKRYIFTVTDSEGCKQQDTITLEGPLPYNLTVDLTQAACRGKEVATKKPSLGAFTITKLEGGNDPAPKLIWEQTVSNLPKGTTLALNTEYKVPAGTYQIQIKDKDNCESTEKIVVPYDASFAVKFGFSLDMNTRVCHGAPYTGIVLKEDPSTPQPLNRKAVTWQALTNYDFKDHTSSGTLDIIEDGADKWKTQQGITSPTLFIASAPTAKCIDTAFFLVTPYQDQQLSFDPHQSKVGVIYNERVIDNEQSSAGNEVYKDSVVLGLLSDAPADLTLKRSNLSSDITFTPAEFYTAKDKSTFTVHLPPGVDKDSRYEVVRQEIDGKTYLFLKTTASVVNPTSQCSSSLDIWLRIIDYLRVPNIFTPNGDGINDRWLCNTDENYITLFSRLQDILPNIEVQVFTRGGLLVWRAKGEAVAEGWDGRARWGGKELPVGTYYYVIKFNVSGETGTWKPITGSVTLIR